MDIFRLERWGLMNHRLTGLCGGAMVALAVAAGHTSVSAGAPIWKGCVYPKAKDVAGHLVFPQPVYIYAEPNPASRRTQLTLFESFNVAAEADGFLQIAGAADAAPDFKEGETIGWVRKAEFDSVPLRNCN